MEKFLTNMVALFENVTNITWQMAVMWIIGAILIYLAIKKEMEPSLLLPMGFWRHPCQPAHVRRDYAGDGGGRPERPV